MLEECKVMVLDPSVQEILQGGEAESKRFFQYQESICRWKIEALLQLKTKPGFNEGSRKLVKSQKKPDKVFFFILLLLGHTQSLSVCFGFISNSRVDGETLRTAIRISLTTDLCALLDQVLYTINRKRLISYIFSRWIFVTLRVIFPWNVPDWS